MKNTVEGGVYYQFYIIAKLMNYNVLTKKGRLQRIELNSDWFEQA